MADRHPSAAAAYLEMDVPFFGWCKMGYFFQLLPRISEFHYEGRQDIGVPLCYNLLLHALEIGEYFQPAVC